MRILWVTSLLPEPPDSGGKIVTFHTVEGLALRGHEITLCALIGKSPESASKLRGLVNLRVPPSMLSNRQDYFHLLKNIFSSQPYVVSKYWSSKTWRFIAEVLREQSYDLMHCDHLHTAPYGLQAREEFGLPVVLTAHNVETVLWEGVSHREHNLAKKAYCHLQRLKMEAYEARTIASFDSCIVLSAEDAERMQRLTPRIRPVVLPPGVDTGYFRPMDIPEESGAIMFLGAMDWFPNDEGILWFYRSVWPTVRKALRETKLYVVGGHPSRAVQRLANDRDVIVTGLVEDIRNYMSRAQVFIAPLRIGSGVRIKILNALAMGKAVVSTSLGCEGIRVNDGENIWIADTADEFARKVVHLLNNEAQRRRLGEAGLQLVRNYYRWDQVAESIERVYRQIVNVERRTLNVEL